MDFLSLLSKIENLYLNWGYPLVFLSSFIEITPFGFLIPGGMMLAAGGFFSYGNKNLFLGILIFGSLGTLSTFLLAYLAGSKSGFLLVKKLHQEKNAARAKHLLDKHGGVILTTALLSSTLRFWVAYIAGVEKYRFSRFVFYATAASFGWVSMYTLAGYIAGTEKENLKSNIAVVGILGWALVLISVGIIYFVTKKEFKEFKGEINEDN